MTKKCPTCGGDGIVLSETSAAVEIERRLRALAAGSRHQAYRVEVAAKVASILIGPGAARLQELEKQTRRRFYLQPKADTHLDHFLVLAEGKREELAPTAPVAEGAKIELKLVEVGLHDVDAGVGKVDGLDVCVANAAKQVGKKVDVQVERVLDDAAYATLVSGVVALDAPITAESEAEKPTRRSAGAAATTTTAELDDPEAEEPDDEEADADEPEEDEADAGEQEPDAEAVTAANGTEPAAPKKKTRRGSRGGRGRKKKTAAAPAAAGNGVGEPTDVAPPAVARIHVPDPDLGEPEESPAESSGEGTETPKPKKKTRRGTRGGRGRKKKTAAAVSTAAAGSPSVGPSDEEPQVVREESPAVAEQEKPSGSEQKASDWEYVPMSQWDDV
jgi:predicted RNA-binding protein with TRAM domain